jgi:hypothetical protein
LLQVAVVEQRCLAVAVLVVIVLLLQANHQVAVVLLKVQ